ncbi:MAG: hydroxyethylthiazole kinase [Chloroflexi bacterium]|nr:hydroxyethylthiazole kinase [Chloroflexota bacterium]
MAAELLNRIRQQRPLIHHITNQVVMNDTANITLAVGASPVMAHAREEVSEMVSFAGALILNPGTLTAERVEIMQLAGARANALGVPIIYDPVGVGATRLRNDAGQRFLKYLRLAVIRGNSGEVGALAGMGGEVKGVDSVRSVDDPIKVTRFMAESYQTVAAITGRRDVISDSLRSIGVDNGHPMLQAITGSGCMATTMIACFCAVERDYLIAATVGLAVFGLAAEEAVQQAHGPGTFRSALLDAVYNLDAAQVRDGIKIVTLEEVRPEG